MPKSIQIMFSYPGLLSSFILVTRGKGFLPSSYHIINNQLTQIYQQIRSSTIPISTNYTKLSQQFDNRLILAIMQQNYRVQIKQRMHTNEPCSSKLSVYKKRGIALKESLPKIKQPKFFHDDSIDTFNLSHQHIFMQRKKMVDQYDWITQEINYEELDEETIVKQNKKLKTSLLQINLELEQIIKTLNSKPRPRIKTLNNNTSTLRIRERQIQNNLSILGFCKKEFKTLEKQKHHIQSNGRQVLEGSIEKTKLNLQKTKKNNVRLKKVNKTLGLSIVGTDDLLFGMRHLEQDVIAYQKKRAYLEEKNNEVSKHIQDLAIKTNNILNSYEIAERYFQKQKDKSTSQNSNMKAAQNYTTQQHHIEILKKKKKGVDKNLQAAYLQKLKQYEDLGTSVSEISHKTVENEEKCRQTSQEIARLKKNLHRIQSKKTIHKNSVMMLTELLSATHKTVDKNDSPPQKRDSEVQANFTTEIAHQQGFEEMSVISSIHEKKMLSEFNEMQES